MQVIMEFQDQVDTLFIPNITVYQQLICLFLSNVYYVAAEQYSSTNGLELYVEFETKKS